MRHFSAAVNGVRPQRIVPVAHNPDLLQTPTNQPHSEGPVQSGRHVQFEDGGVDGGNAAGGGSLRW